MLAQIRRALRTIFRDRLILSKNVQGAKLHVNIRVDTASFPNPYCNAPLASRNHKQPPPRVASFFHIIKQQMCTYCLLTISPNQRAHLYEIATYARHVRGSRQTWCQSTTTSHDEAQHLSVKRLQMDDFAFSKDP